MAETVQEKVITMPLFIQLGKAKTSKRYHINLNNYRNWHYITSNKLKKAYKELALSQLEDLSFDKIELTFTFYKGWKRKIDRSNVLSVHEKFFCDALVEEGCLPDDNDDFLLSTHYYSGGLDRENPRVEIKINEV